MNGLLVRMFSALFAGIVGLFMLFWALERVALTATQAKQMGSEATPGWHVYALLFGGLVVVNLATFFALTHWSRYLQDHPRTKQLAVVLQVSVLAAAGSALIAGIAVHSDKVLSHNPVPMAVNAGYIAYEVLFSTIVISALVLLAVRWSPGFRRRPIED